MFRVGQNLVKRVLRGKLDLKAAYATKQVQEQVSCSHTSSMTEQPEDGPGSIPFCRAKTGPFLQQMPMLGNQYLEDVTLKCYLKRVLPENVLCEVTPDLERFGNRVATDIFKLGEECEKNPPRLVHYDAWGKRIDEIITCNAWKQQKTISAEEGLIAIAYERKQGPWSRIYQMVKLFLYSPSSGLYSCPLAMTDGAAKILEVVSGGNLPSDKKNQAYANLLSRDPRQFWTSGQWMTEKRGGSDVGLGTETLAVPQADGTYRLYGYKWFSSATDSDMSITLARIVDSSGKATPGSKGLTMFYLETRDSEGTLNNIEVPRLKDKLGTRQLPTAELLLDGTKAYKLSEESRGVANISYMLNITRLHNTISSAAGMRRMVNLARDYCHKRSAFGKQLKDHALHMKTLADMEVETRGASLLCLEIARLLGKEDCKQASDHEMLLYRLLTPIAKLYTAKQAVAVASEGLECFGGMGFLEDSGLPALLRDAQVLPIWEGTTNILSLDALRSLGKSNGEVLQAFQHEVHTRLSGSASNPQLTSCCNILKHSADQCVQFAHNNMTKLEPAGRDFAFSLARIYIGMLLVEHAAWIEATSQDVLTAKRWCEKDLTPMLRKLESGNYEPDTYNLELALVMDGYKPTSSQSSKL